MSTYMIAELGHNWAPKQETALRMVEQAALAGADAVKVQLRTLPDCIPVAQRERPRVVAWTGEIVSYAEYRALCELDAETLALMADRAHQLGLGFGASAFDTAALERITWRPAFIKVPSAAATDLAHVEASAWGAIEHGVPVLISTGAMTWAQTDDAMDVCARVGCETWVAQCTSTYPASPRDLNLLAIPEMIRRYPRARVGYSNHAVSVAPSIAAVGLGATWVEAHVTLDRSLPGTDQAASFEFGNFARLRAYVRHVESALGDGVKAPTPGELEVMEKLRAS